MQEIRITGDLVQLVETNITRTIPLMDWLPRIERRLPVSMPVLPSSTRAIWWDPVNATKRLVIMLEREPHIAHIRYNYHTYAISIPWTRMIFLASTTAPDNDTLWRLDDYKIFWAKDRYTDPNAQDMIPAMIPNVYSDGRICFGSTGVAANQSLANRLDQTLNVFYASTFNNDLGIRYPTGIRGFNRWQTASRRNPLLWTEWTDFDPAQTAYTMNSWEQISREFGEEGDVRAIPRTTNDAIPHMALEPSFGRAVEWLTSLNPTGRNALRRAMAEMAADPEDPEPVEDDEDDDDDPE